MGGVSQRFKDKGYLLPKSLLDVDGKPMIEHIVSNFSSDDDLTFICNKELLESSNLAQVLSRISPNGRIVEIEPHKNGPVHTVLMGMQGINQEKPVIVNYCDFGWNWNYLDFKNEMRESGAAGCVVGYTGFHPHLLHGNLYAGIRADEGNRIVEIKEKHRFTQDPMKTIHSSGTYYFSSGELMKEYFLDAVHQKKRVNGEFYVSSVYEQMVADGLDVRTYIIPKFMQWGTPEDFKEYQKWSHAFRKGTAENLVKSQDTRRTHDYWKEHFDSLKGRK